MSACSDRREDGDWHLTGDRQILIIGNFFPAPPLGRPAMGTRSEVFFHA